MRKHYIYESDGEGGFRAVQTKGAALKYDWNNKSFPEQQLRGYYDLECSGKFRRKDMSKDFIKSVWKERIARG